MSTYDLQPSTKKSLFRRLFPITALHKRSDSDLFREDKSTVSTEYHSGTLTERLGNLFHICWPWSRRAEVLAQLRVCQDQIRNLSVAHAEIAKELKTTQEALSGYVRQCSLRCSNFEYVPGDIPDELPTLDDRDSNDSSIISEQPEAPPTTEVRRRGTGTERHFYHG
jgi:hypothetical protein